MLLAGCRQSDDVVATLKDAGSPVPPIEDADTWRPDASIEHDAPHVTMDVELPRPDVVIDVTPPPPPVDASPPMCSATGPLLSVRRINGTGAEVCAGQLAAHTFTHALCACEDLNLAALLSTLSLDSSSADKKVISSGAPVGIGGTYPSAKSNIGGSLTLASTVRTTVSTGLEVQGDLRLAGQATFYNTLSVKRDTWNAIKLGYWGIVRIDGTLYNAPGATYPGIGPFVTGSQVTTPFTIEDPCRCAERLDVAEMVRLGALRTDNAVRGIDVALLNNVTTATNVTLPCGRFRFESIGGPGALRLTITGRTVIFVDGNVTFSDASYLAIAPGGEAEVDLFIRGNLTIGTAHIGDTNRPSATRIYVAGNETDIVLATGDIGANIYAPNTNVNLPALGLEGSIYGKNLTMLGGGIVRYDRAILNAGNKCEQPTTCTKCEYCNGGAACINGGCGRCTSDADCCAPLVCVQNACQPLLFE